MDRMKRSMGGYRADPEIRGGMRGRGFNEPFPQTTGRNMHLRETLDMMNGQSFKRAPLGAIPHRSSDPFGQVHSEGMNGTCFYQPPLMANTNTLTNGTMTMRGGLAPERIPLAHMEDRSNPHFGQISREGMNGTCFYQPPPMANTNTLTNDTMTMRSGLAPEIIPLAHMEDRSNPHFGQISRERMNGNCFYQPPPMGITHPMASDNIAARRGLALERAPLGPIEDRSINSFTQPNRQNVFDQGSYENSVQMREAHASPMVIMKGLPPDRVPPGPIEGSLAAPSKKVKKKGKRSKRSKKAECVSKVDQNSMDIDALEKSVYMREANASSTAIMKGVPPDRAPLGPIKVNDAMSMRRDLASEGTPLGPVKNCPKPNGKSVHDYGFYEKSVQMREATTPSTAVMKGLSFDRAPLGPIQTNDTVAMERGLTLERAPLGPIEGRSASPSKEVKKVKRQGKHSKRSKKAEFDSVVDTKSLAMDALAPETEFASQNTPFIALWNDTMANMDYETEINDIYEDTHRCSAPGPSMADDFVYSTHIKETFANDFDKVKTLEEELAEIKNQTNTDIENLAAQFEIDLDTLSSEASNAPLSSGECKEKLFQMAPMIHSPANASSNIQPTWKEVEQEETADVVVEVLPRYLHTPSKPAHGPTDHGATGDASLQPKVEICEDSKHIRELPHIKEETYEPSIEQNTHKINSDHGQRAISSVLLEMHNTVRPYEVEVERSNMMAAARASTDFGPAPNIECRTKNEQTKRAELIQTDHAHVAMVEHHDGEGKDEHSSEVSEHTQLRSISMPRFKMDTEYESEKEVVARVGPANRNIIKITKDERNNECMKDVCTMATPDKIITSTKDVFNGATNVKFEKKRQVPMSTIETQTDILEDDLDAQIRVDDMYMQRSENTWSSQSDVEIGQFEFENKRQVLLSTIETQTDILDEDLNDQIDVDDTYMQRSDDTYMQRSENTSQRDVETEPVNSSFGDIMGTYTDNRRIVKTGESGVETIRAVASLVDSFSILMNNKHTCTSTPTTIANGTRDDTNADRHQIADDKSNDIINKMENKETQGRTTFKDAGISTGTHTVYNTAEDASKRSSRPSNWYVSIEKYQNGIDNRCTEPVKIYHHTLRQRQWLLNNGHKSKYISISTINSTSFTRDDTNEDRYQIVDDKSSDFINKLGSTETPYRQTTKRAGISSGTQTVYSAAKGVSKRNYRPPKSDVYNENYQNGIDNPKYTESANIHHHTLNERQRILDNGNNNTYTSTPTTIANDTSLTRDATNADRYQIVDDTSSDLVNKLKSTESQNKKTIKHAGISSCTQTVYSTAKDVSQRNPCPSNSYGYTENFQNSMANPKYPDSTKPPDDTLSKRQRAYKKCTKYLESIDVCNEPLNRYTEQPWHGEQQGDWNLNEYRSMDEEHPGQNIFKNLKLDLPVVAERPNRLFETTSQTMPHGYQELDEDLKSDTGQQDRSDKYRIGTPPGDDDAEETGCCGCFPRNSKRPSNKNNSNKGSRGGRVMRFCRRVKVCFT